MSRSIAERQGFLKNWSRPQCRDEFEMTKGLIKIRMKGSNPSLPPVLFVPGSFSGAWIWKDNFLPFFHALGHEVAAMSFSGHGKTSLKDRLRGLEEFEKDLINVLSEFDSPPVVVAHSLGGLVAKRVATCVQMRALCLLSPIPDDGAARSVWKLFKKSPASAFKLAAVAFEPRFTRLANAPVGIYSSKVNATTQAQVTGRLQAESVRVLMESLKTRPRPLGQHDVPVHYWGAEGDHIIPASEVERVARMNKAPFKIMAGMSHTFQAEPNWDELAADIVNWLAAIAASDSLHLKTN
ncbi:MAG: alpha/beta hydrolase [Limnobacter sp.]|nr:alpha/beta hydrolase [Limnobacter sp.]